MLGAVSEPKPQVSGGVRGTSLCSSLCPLCPSPATPWNISIFALMGVVVVISMVLLGRSIKENR